jgi:hypothetical protein
MSRIAKEILIAGQTPNFLSKSAYDSTKWNFGKGWINNNGGTAIDKYAQTQFSVIRPMEESTPFAISYTIAVPFSATIDYVFGIENATTASATRRIALWTVNKETGATSWNGFITITLASATAHTVRDFKIDRKQESTGTVQTTGTALTGAGTLFATNKVAIGARIGFGSTDASQITQWYRISARASDTGLTLATSPGNIPASTPYVIEEYRPVYLATNATTTNGGIHYAKGVSIEDFTSFGTTIPLAVATDDQKAVYWIKDASTQTNIVAAGIVIDFAAATPTLLEAYVMDLVAAGNYKFYKYNLRAALTVATGASTSAWLIATGSNPFTGTGSQNAAVAIATANHGTGSGVKCLYLVTTTRIYRVPVTQITTTSATVFSSPSDNIAEIPPGGASTYAVTNGLSTIEYMSDADAFIIGTTGATVMYVSQYVSSGQQFQNMFGRNFVYTEQSLKDSNAPTIFNLQGFPFSFHDSGNGSNIVYACKQGTAGTNMHIYPIAFGADWNYAAASSGRLISPSISVPNASKFSRVFVNAVKFLGSTTLGKPAEPIRIYARTANITTDATSGWTLLDETGDLSGFAGAANIQFAIEQRTIGETCLPQRILGVNVVYEDTTTDSRFAFSAKSSAASKQFVWEFTTAFGSAVPNLRVNLYNRVTGGLLVTDTSALQAAGSWEKSVNDGVSWTAYNSTDKANELTYIRFTPTSLADNIKVSAYLVQA